MGHARQGPARRAAGAVGAPSLWHRPGSGVPWRGIQPISAARPGRQRPRCDGGQFLDPRPPRAAVAGDKEMSRSGYSDDLDNWSQIKWRGQVASAIRGRRGQAFLRELADALDAMPVKRLIRDELRAAGEVCALGCIGAKRGVDLEGLDPENHEKLAEAFGIARQLVMEIEWVNDERDWRPTPEEL